jgi:hypothetical protein
LEFPRREALPPAVADERDFRAADAPIHHVVREITVFQRSQQRCLEANCVQLDV